MARWRKESEKATGYKKQRGGRGSKTVSKLMGDTNLRQEGRDRNGEPESRKWWWVVLGWLPAQATAALALQDGCPDIPPTPIPGELGAGCWNDR